MYKKFVFQALLVSLCFYPSLIQGANPSSEAGVLTVKHLGHASFLITAPTGTTLVTDPFLSGYGSPFPHDLSVDLVLVSANGPDHDAAHQLRGNPVILTSGRSSAEVADFQVEGFPIPSAGEKKSPARYGYVVRHADVKLVFLGEIDDVLPPAVLQLGEEADAVLAGFPPEAPALKQFAGSPKLRTLVSALIKPGSQLPIELKDWAQLETDAVKISREMPRQVVALKQKAQENVGAGAPDYSVFRDTLVELTWPQLQRAANENALVLVPVGVIEEHGPHMGLGADTYLAHLHCRRLKTALAGLGTRALIAPPLYWGITDDTSRFPGSFNMRSETMAALITDLCRSLHEWGFRRLVFVNEHGNRNHRRTLLDTLSKVRQELNLEAFSLDAMMTGAAVYQPRRTPGRYSPDYHAGAGETAVMWQEFPADVDTRLAQKLKPQSEFLPFGYVGDPASYAQEESLSDYLKQAPQYDARRVQAFFSLSEAAKTTPMVNIDSAARRLLDRYIESVGGSAKLETIKTQSRTGSLLEDNRTIPLQGLWSVDGKWALSLQQAPGATERFGFTGLFGWHAERGEVGQLPEPLVFVISLALDPQMPLRLTGLFSKLTLAGERPSGDGRVDILEGETIAGVKARLTFDRATGLLMRINDTTFEDYRKVDGIEYPFAVTVRPGTRVQFERIENNISVASAEFEPPK